MKRIRFVLGLFIGVLLVVALAFPAAVLAEESAAATEAEASVTEAAIETAVAAEAETIAEQVAVETAVTAETETTAAEPAEMPPAEEVPPPQEIPPEEMPPPEEIPPEEIPPEEMPPEEIPPEEVPGAAIEGLISTVEGYNLQQGIENSLDSKLQNAKDSLTAANAGLREDAVNKLQAFISACEAQRDKALDSWQANELIEMANNIILSL